MENEELITRVNALWIVVTKAVQAIGMEVDGDDEPRLRTFEALSDRLSTLEYDLGTLVRTVISDKDKPNVRTLHARLDALEATNRSDYDPTAKAAIKALNDRIDALIPDSIRNDGWTTVGYKDGQPVLGKMGVTIPDDDAPLPLYPDRVNPLDIQGGDRVLRVHIDVQEMNEVKAIIATLKTEIATRDRLLDDQAATIGKLEAERNVANDKLSMVLSRVQGMDLNNPDKMRGMYWKPVKGWSQ